jgi:hypothetical protein
MLQIKVDVKNNNVVVELRWENKIFWTLIAVMVFLSFTFYTSS